ncbi:expressed unknown protein [Seminavis robusta]|uniref:Transmembrane protein n=1 Tax=Seminavis robusta TaxID=568900 RepID=A0A9N8E8E7_9STRA|nr:expressed unknown protein [Seminavis robusta]|eukprot:Sro659_g182860.1 n/a (182) ;mRNA; r:8448-8993
MTKPKKKSTVDVESHQQQQQQAVRNPYSSSMEPEVLPIYHPINILKRSLYIGISLYVLEKLDAHKAIFHAPDVSHEWFKIGLGGTIAIMMIKAYVELYSGKLQQQKVNYENFKQTTHAVLFLLISTSIAFHVALWPHYGTTTFLVLFLVGVVLLQTALLIPPYLQNLICIVGMTFFLQEYK